MKPRLPVLNLVLVAALVWTGVEFRQRWLAAKAREAATLDRRIDPAPPPPFSRAPETPALQPSGYADIAQKDLFHPSRNPTVVIEVPPPPPPKPMPGLPVYHGMMNLGGVFAILSVKSGAAHEAVHPGETIGQFKLLDVNTQEITFEWDGQVVRKTLEEIADRTAPVQSSEAPRSESASAASSPVAPVKTPTGPGESTNFGFKTCKPNDSTAEGAVVDGYRKVTIATPFGQACRWEPLGK
jgi:hypothetical protein